MTSDPRWLSDTVWLVLDRFELSSGRVIERILRVRPHKLQARM
jgi:hypothetical protein